MFGREGEGMRQGESDWERQRLHACKNLSFSLRYLNNVDFFHCLSSSLQISANNIQNWIRNTHNRRSETVCSGTVFSECWCTAARRNVCSLPTNCSDVCAGNINKLLVLYTFIECAEKHSEIDALLRRWLILSNWALCCLKCAYAQFCLKCVLHQVFAL